MSMWNPHELPDLSNRVFAVTGATGGIGYFAAEQLAAAGASVILTARSRNKFETAAKTLSSHVPGADLQFVTLELASLESSADAGRALAALDRLDGVFLNAGPMQFSSSVLTQDGLH